MLWGQPINMTFQYFTNMVNNLFNYVYSNIDCLVLDIDGAITQQTVQTNCIPQPRVF